MGHLGPRISHLASQLWIRCNDCFTILNNERSQDRYGNYVNGFSERNLVHSKFGHFGTKIVILHNKRDQEIHKNFISCFLRKNLIWGNLIFSGHFLMFDWVWSKLSQATVTIGSLKSQDMIKILKQSGHDVSGKYLCGRCCS